MYKRERKELCIFIHKNILNITEIPLAVILNEFIYIYDDKYENIEKLHELLKFILDIKEIYSNFSYVIKVPRNMNNKHKNRLDKLLNLLYQMKYPCKLKILYYEIHILFSICSHFEISEPEKLLALIVRKILKDNKLHLN